MEDIAQKVPPQLQSLQLPSAVPAKLLSAWLPVHKEIEREGAGLPVLFRLPSQESLSACMSVAETPPIVQNVHSSVCLHENATNACLQQHIRMREREGEIGSGATGEERQRGEGTGRPCLGRRVRAGKLEVVGEGQHIMLHGRGSTPCFSVLLSFVCCSKEGQKCPRQKEVVWA